jgi:hypothetical protein
MTKLLQVVFQIGKGWIGSSLVLIIVYISLFSMQILLQIWRFQPFNSTRTSNLFLVQCILISILIFAKCKTLSNAPSHWKTNTGRPRDTYWIKPFFGSQGRKNSLIRCRIINIGSKMILIDDNFQHRISHRMFSTSPVFHIEICVIQIYIRFVFTLLWQNASTTTSLCKILSHAQHNSSSNLEYMPHHHRFIIIIIIDSSSSLFVDPSVTSIRRAF